MAATTVMHDELTGVTLIIHDDETSELMTVLINGRETLVPEEKHCELYTVASSLQDMMRKVKMDAIEQGAMKGPSDFSQRYREFNEAVLKFTSMQL